jgi:hypothetical protein
MDKHPDVDADTLKNSLIYQPTFDYKTACKQSKHLSILIQHVANAKTLDKMIQTGQTFIKQHLLHVLYQIYMPLSTLGDKFTHYDLHSDNILLYEPAKGKYIHYHYHLADGRDIEFKSPYVAKIIDYGRSYFYDTADNNSKKIYNNVCATWDCHPRCGSNVGFVYLNSETNPGDNAFIISSKSNISHDLRLLDIINSDYAAELDKYVKAIVENVKYRVGVKKDMKEYGTKEQKVHGTPPAINQVHDAYKLIQKALLKPSIVLKNNTLYPSDTAKLGELHVYADGRPMNYIHNS